MVLTSTLERSFKKNPPCFPNSDIGSRQKPYKLHCINNRRYLLTELLLQVQMSVDAPSWSADTSRERHSPPVPNRTLKRSNHKVKKKHSKGHTNDKNGSDIRKRSKFLGGEKTKPFKSTSDYHYYFHNDKIFIFECYVRLFKGQIQFFNKKKRRPAVPFKKHSTTEQSRAEREKGRPLNNSSNRRENIISRRRCGMDFHNYPIKSPSAWPSWPNNTSNLSNRSTPFGSIHSKGQVTRTKITFIYGCAGGFHQQLSLAKKSRDPSEKPEDNMKIVKWGEYPWHKFKRVSRIESEDTNWVLLPSNLGSPPPTPALSDDPVTWGPKKVRLSDSGTHKPPQRVSIILSL